MRRLLAASLVTATLAAFVATGPVRAQTPEAEAHGIQIAEVLLKVLPLEELVLGAEPGAFVRSRPEWNDYYAQALAEEFRHDIPAFERMLGKALARCLSPTELEAGAAILTDPASTRVFTGIGGDQLSPEAERARSSAAGRTFMTKLATFADIINSLEGEFMDELMPGAIRRFAVKLEASVGPRAQEAASSVK